MNLAIGKLLDINGDKLLGTAFAVSPSRALTAFHCIGNRDTGDIWRKQVLLEFVTGDQIIGEFEGGSHVEDYAILSLQSRLPETLVPVLLLDKAYVNETFRVGGYPSSIYESDNPNPDINFPGGVVRAPDTSIFGGIPAIELHCDESAAGLSLHGMSGAPVLVGQDPEGVVGLVRWNIPRKDAPNLGEGGNFWACPIKLIVEKHSKGTDLVLHVRPSKEWNDFSSDALNSVPEPCPYGWTAIHTSDDNEKISVRFQWMQPEEYEKYKMVSTIATSALILISLLSFLAYKEHWLYAKIISLIYAWWFTLYGFWHLSPITDRPPEVNINSIKIFLLVYTIYCSVISIFIWFLFQPIFQFLRDTYIVYLFIVSLIAMIVGGLIEILNMQSMGRVESTLTKDHLSFVVRGIGEQRSCGFPLIGIEKFDFQSTNNHNPREIRYDERDNSSQLYFVHEGEKISFNSAFNRNVNMSKEAAEWTKKKLQDALDVLKK